MSRLDRQNALDMRKMIAREEARKKNAAAAAGSSAIATATVHTARGKIFIFH